jgi:hypothetical protein
MAGQAKDRLSLGFLVFLVSLLNVSFSWAQPVTRDVCLGCHSVPGLQKTRDGKNLSLQIDKDTFDQSIHRVFECTSSHSDILQLPHKAELKPVQCDTCHTASVKAYTESIHAKARTQGFKEPPTCMSCHGDIHKLVPRSELSSPVHAKNIAKTCAVCHADTEMAKKFRSRLSGRWKPTCKALTRALLRQEKAELSVRIAMERTPFFPLTMPPRKFLGRKFPRLAVLPRQCSHCLSSKYPR